jgi:hypothetical protein
MVTNPSNMRSSDLLASILFLLVAFSLSQFIGFLAYRTGNSLDISTEDSSKTVSTMNPFKEEKDREELIGKCEGILKEHPGNRCAKYLKEYVNTDEFKALSESGQ